MEGESFVTPMETSERGSDLQCEEDLEGGLLSCREGRREGNVKQGALAVQPREARETGRERGVR